MSTIKAIRKLLNVTQVALAEGMGCTQGNVSFYERGQTVPPDAAMRLVAFAKTKGYELSLEHIYAGAPLPDSIAAQAEKAA